ncbi:MAG: transketolase [Gemmatimonadota bacterium]|nr:MAG: transketolase [Gemmatimonadota bacterium]
MSGVSETVRETQQKKRLKACRQMATKIRAHCLRMTHRGRSGHIGSMLSMADLAAVLYVSALRVDPREPRRPDRDRFVLSKGHGGAAIYAALAERGFFPTEWLHTYYLDDGRLSGHISHHVPGVEFSTGSLGHGLPVAVGMALAAQHDGRDHRVFCLLSDGDCNEGSTWEAIMIAAHHGLDNLTAIVDYNRVQALGKVEDVLELEPFAQKLEDFGWAVRSINGHEYCEIDQALREVPYALGRPSWIVARTVKGKGVSWMEGTVDCHYGSVTDAELETALKELGVDTHAQNGF